MTQLIRYEQARTALAACHSVDEVKDIRDKAEAMAAYARLAKDTDMILWATEIKVRAERKCGDLLLQAERGSPGRPPANSSKAVTEYQEALETSGLSRMAASRYQQLASMSEDHFEAAVATAKDTAGQVTTAFMLREAQAVSPRKLKPKKLNKADALRLDALEASRTTASVLVGHIRMVLMSLRGKDSLTEPEREALGQLRTEIDSAIGVYCQ